MTSKCAGSVPLTKAEAEQLQIFARHEGISDDEAATRLVQAGLAGIATPKQRKKPAKVVKLKRKAKK